MNKLYSILALSMSSLVFSQKYACFQNDENPKLQISVKFDKNEKPISVQYLGQTQEISLKFKEVLHGSQLFSSEVYNEIVDGRKNGEYQFEFDYSEETTGVGITYTRKDRKEFSFESLDRMGDKGKGIFRKNKCF